MNPFQEFQRIVVSFQEEGIQYALIGAVAVAFHTEARFTRDIDILVKGAETERVCRVLEREGYFRSSEPWTFKGVPLTLHRFLKVAGKDEMIIDVLVAGTDRLEKVVDCAWEADSDQSGTIRLASKEDLIWLKRLRNSKQDQADIERLLHEKNR